MVALSTLQYLCHRVVSGAGLQLPAGPAAEHIPSRTYVGWQTVSHSGSAVLATAAGHAML